LKTFSPRISSTAPTCPSVSPISFAEQATGGGWLPGAAWAFREDDRVVLRRPPWCAAAREPPAALRGWALRAPDVFLVVFFEFFLAVFFEVFFEAFFEADLRVVLRLLDDFAGVDLRVVFLRAVMFDLPC
jgi:hypothetical protein